jgi:uncharacterized protein (TIGR02145 family)
MNMKRVFTTVVVITTFLIACKKDKPQAAPSVTTASLKSITTSSATAGGTITSDGNVAITAAGIVLSKVNISPTIADTVLNSTVSTGSFTVNLTNLDFNTTYYLRAYATNSIGTGYGEVITLNTSNDTTKVRFTYNGATVIYGVITSNKTGKKWLDRNLGATNMAISLTDSLAYGDLFEWGRLADRHQLRASDTTTTLASTDNPGHNKFIVSVNNPVLDWRNPQNNNLWQGSLGINNPCPTGWHIPTKTEWEAEAITDQNSGFNFLKLVLAGSRSRLSGNLRNIGTSSSYWSSSVSGNGTWSYSIELGLSTVNDRGLGGSVRCIKD